MPRTIHRLTPLEIKNAKERGWYGDGGGLALQVSENGGKSWVFRYMRHRKPVVLGLGSLIAVDVKEARARAAELRKVLSEGRDPRQERATARAEQKRAECRSITFKECAEAYIAAQRHGWKNAKHAEQWSNTLRTYVYDIMGDTPVRDIDTDLVRRCLDPIWTTKTETASRVRNRIELILSWAAAADYRSVENPARWRGHLDKLLAPPKKVAPVEHFAALPYEELGAFMAELREDAGTPARALEFLILTGVRSENVRCAVWSEIDFNKSTWTIPKSRMKAGREHRVPLSKRALEILREMERIKESEHVFPGAKADRPVSTLDPPMKRICADGITVHGFRSTLRDWASETTAYPSEVVEMVLAHSIRNGTEAAYRRGNLLAKRAEFMEEWSRYCLTDKKPAHSKKRHRSH